MELCLITKEYVIFTTVFNGGGGVGILGIHIRKVLIEKKDLNYLAKIKTRNLSEQDMGFNDIC